MQQDSIEDDINILQLQNKLSDSRVSHNFHAKDLSYTPDEHPPPASSRRRIERAKTESHASAVQEESGDEDVEFPRKSSRAGGVLGYFARRRSTITSNDGDMREVAGGTHERSTEKHQQHTREPSDADEQSRVQYPWDQKRANEEPQRPDRRRRRDEDERRASRQWDEESERRNTRDAESAGDRRERERERVRERSGSRERQHTASTSNSKWEADSDDEKDGGKEKDKKGSKKKGKEKEKERDSHKQMHQNGGGGEGWQPDDSEVKAKDENASPKRKAGRETLKKWWPKIFTSKADKERFKQLAKQQREAAAAAPVNSRSSANSGARPVCFGSANIVFLFERSRLLFEYLNNSLLNT